ncbi:hypothetical protein KM043_003281 [Ampulex compressa]|nr:hypothetical protein KM043_003281 [Ampulex compressa]
MISRFLATRRTSEEDGFLERSGIAAYLVGGRWCGAGHPRVVTLLISRSTRRRGCGETLWNALFRRRSREPPLGALGGVEPPRGTRSFLLPRWNCITIGVRRPSAPCPLPPAPGQRAAATSGRPPGPRARSVHVAWHASPVQYAHTKVYRGRSSARRVPIAPFFLHRPSVGPPPALRRPFPVRASKYRIGSSADARVHFDVEENFRKNRADGPRAGPLPYGERGVSRVSPKVQGAVGPAGRPENKGPNYTPDDTYGDNLPIDGSQPDSSKKKERGRKGGLGGPLRGPAAGARLQFIPFILARNSESALADLLSATIEPDLGVDLADLFARNELKRQKTGGRSGERGFASAKRPRFTPDLKPNSDAASVPPMLDESIRLSCDELLMAGGCGEGDKEIERPRNGPSRRACEERLSEPASRLGNILELRRIEG